MPWSVDYDEEHGFVEIEYSGSTTGDDLRMATREAIALSEQHGALKCIVDCTYQEKTGDVLDLYEFPKIYEGAGLSRAIQLALLMPLATELHEFAEFYENVCVNRGWQVRTFRSREQAFEWLGDSSGFAD